MKYYHYTDTNGKEITAGMRIRIDGGEPEEVYEFDDSYGLPDLWINASNEAFLAKHPDYSREYYPLSNWNSHYIEIVEG